VEFLFQLTATGAQQKALPVSRNSCSTQNLVVLCAQILPPASSALANKLMLLSSGIRSAHQIFVGKPQVSAQLFRFVSAVPVSEQK
jgi:hypothetical protein